MADAEIPAGFKMPEELWLMVDEETGEPIEADQDGIRYLVSFNREDAKVSASTLGYAIPVQVYPRPPVAPTITVRAKERPFTAPTGDRTFIAYDDHNEPDYVRAAGLGTAGSDIDEGGDE